MKPPCPYVGPRPFDTVDATRFHGRARAIAALASLVRSRPASLLYSPSGAGKSSLIRAGLVAHLTTPQQPPPGSRAGPRVLMRVVTGRVLSPDPAPPGTNPLLWALLESLAEHDPAATTRSFGDGGHSLHDLLQPLTDPDRDGRIGPREPPVLLIVDQLEQVFEGGGGTRVTRNDRTRFFEALGKVLDSLPNLHLLLAMREDYLAHLLPYAAFLPDRLAARYRLEQLSELEALEAIERPASEAGIPFAAGAARRLVRDLSGIELAGAQAPSDSVSIDGVPESPIEPVYLQIVCTALWNSLPDDAKQIDQAAILRSAVTENALIRFIDDVVTGATRAAGGHDDGPLEARIREFLEEKLVSGGRVRAVVNELDATGAIGEPALNALQSLYLLRRIEVGRRVSYEIAHDRLLAPLIAANALWRERRPLLSREAASWKRDPERAQAEWTPAVIQQAAAALRAHPDRYGGDEAAMVDAMLRWKRGRYRDLLRRWGFRVASAAIVILCVLVTWQALSSDKDAMDRMGVAAERAEEQGEPMVAWAILHEIAHRRGEGATGVRATLGADAPAGMMPAFLRLLDQALPSFEGVAIGSAVTEVYLDAAGTLYSQHAGVENNGWLRWPKPAKEKDGTTLERAWTRLTTYLTTKTGTSVMGDADQLPVLIEDDPTEHAPPVSSCEASVTGDPANEPPRKWSADGVRAQACLEAGDAALLLRTYLSEDANPCLEDPLAARTPLTEPLAPPREHADGDQIKSLVVVLTQGSVVLECSALPFPKAVARGTVSPDIGLVVVSKDRTTAILRNPGRRWIGVDTTTPPKAESSRLVPWSQLEPGVEAAKPCDGDKAGILRILGERELDWVASPKEGLPLMRVPLRASVAGSIADAEAKDRRSTRRITCRATKEHIFVAAGTDAGEVLGWRLRRDGWPLEEIPNENPQKSVVSTTQQLDAASLPEGCRKVEPPADAPQTDPCSEETTSDTKDIRSFFSRKDAHLYRRPAGDPVGKERWIADPWGFGSSASGCRASLDEQFVFPTGLESTKGAGGFRLVPVQGTMALELQPDWTSWSADREGHAYLCQDKEGSGDAFVSVWHPKARSPATEEKPLTRTWTLDPDWDYLDTLAARYPYCLTPGQRIRYLHETIEGALVRAAMCEQLHPRPTWRGQAQPVGR